MLFHVLGSLEIHADQGVLELKGGRPRAFLTTLLLQPRQVVPVHRLAAQIWGDNPPGRLEPAIHTIAARVRRAMGEQGRRIVTRPPGYLLDVADDEIDAAHFEMLCRAAREAADPARGAAILDEALALFRGPAFSEFADGFASTASIRLAELRTVALEDRAAHQVALGIPEDAVARSADLIAEHPLRERPVEILMSALHQQGRTAEALEAFQRHRTVLAEELGLDVTGRLRALQGAMLRGELPSLGSARRRTQLFKPVEHWRAEPPGRPSQIIGRTGDLSALVGALEKNRLVTLVGPGGVGKTRLALEAAHRILESGGRVCWIDLVPVTPEDLPDVVAGALGTERVGDDPGLAALAGSLGGQHGVIVLDNAEHLLEPLAAFAERLAGAAPDLALLVTSRERLAVDVERVYSLPALPLPAAREVGNPAVRLFMARAGMSDGRLSGEELDLVVRICRCLDGLPLAIELAAARAASLGVRALADRLGDRLDLLAGGRRTAAARHRTIRAVLDWSHNLLKESEARLFARLSVFPGGFTVDQAETVCSDEDLPKSTVAQLLSRLVEQSLVQAHDGRFWLLETLRVYAAERLPETESMPLSARHAADTADRLRSWVADLWTQSEPVVVRRIAALHPDLLAAWNYAAAHDRPLAVHLAADVYDYAFFRQEMQFLHWGSQVAAWEIQHPRLAAALATAACAAWSDRSMDEARRLIERAAAVADAEDPEAIGRVLDVRSDLDMFDGRIPEAVAGYLAAASASRQQGAPARGLSLEIAAAHAGSYGPGRHEARASLPGLLRRAKVFGVPSIVSYAYFVSALFKSDHNIAGALQALEQSIAHGQVSDNRLFSTMARTSGGALLAVNGPPEQALERFRDVLEHWEGVGNRAAQWWCLSYLIVLLFRIGRTGEAALLTGAADASLDRRESFSALGAHNDARSRYESVVGSLRLTHGDAVARGETMELTDAVALARRVTAEPVIRAAAPLKTA